MTKKETKIDLRPCPCGQPPGILRLEAQGGQGTKIVQVRGSCCGEWAIEFINNSNDQTKTAERAAAAWNRAPRAVIVAPAL